MHSMDHSALNIGNSTKMHMKQKKANGLSIEPNDQRTWKSISFLFDSKLSLSKF